MGRSAVAWAARRIRVDARSLRKTGETALANTADSARRWRDTTKAVAARSAFARHARVAAGTAVRLGVARATASLLVTTPCAVAGIADGLTQPLDATPRSTGLTLNPVQPTVERAASDDAGFSGAAPAAGAGPTANRDAPPELAREVGAGVARHAAESARAGLVSVLTGAQRVTAAGAVARAAPRRRHACVSARDDEAVPGHVRNAGDWRASIGGERVAATTTATPAAAAAEERDQQQQQAERTHGANRHPPRQPPSRS